MKLAVSSYSLSRWRSANNKTYEQMIDWIADHEVGAVEFSGLDEKAADAPLKRAEAIRKHCEKRGQAVAGYSVGAELLVPAAAQKKVIERLKLDVDIAATLGAQTMRHDVSRGFGDHSKGLDVRPTFANAVKVVAPAIREVTEYAAEKGVKTSLENHGFYMQASERVRKLIETVDHPNYGLTMDMGNFLCVNEDPIEAVQNVAKLAIMVHVKDFHVKPKKQAPPTGWIMTPTPIAIRGAIVGHGNIDIPRQLKILKKVGYDWFLSLEFEGMEEPAFAVETGLNYLKQQFEELGIE